MTRQAEKSNFNVTPSRRWVGSSMCDRIKKRKTNNQTVNKNDESPSGVRKQRMHDTRSRKLVNLQAKMMNWEVIVLPTIGQKLPSSPAAVSPWWCEDQKGDIWKKGSNLIRRQSFSKKLTAQILRKQDKLNLMSSAVLYPQFRPIPINITSLVTLFFQNTS